MPSNKEPTDKCFIGGSHLNETEHVFKGQMAAVYVFAEPLGYNAVVALYRMGPGYKVCMSSNVNFTSIFCP